VTRPTRMVWLRAVPIIISADQQRRPGGLYLFYTPCGGPHLAESHHEGQSKIIPTVTDRRYNFAIRVGKGLDRNCGITFPRPPADLSQFSLFTGKASASRRVFLGGQTSGWRGCFPPGCAWPHFQTSAYLFMSKIRARRLGRIAITFVLVPSHVAL